MKTILTVFLLSLMTFAQDASPAVVPPSSEGVMIVPIDAARKVVPVFFSADAKVSVQVFHDRVETESRVVVQLHQGKADVFSLALTGTGEVATVTGDGLRDWAVRVGEAGVRYLDIRANADAAADRKNWEFVVKSVQKSDSATRQIDVLLPGKGAAVGYAMHVTMIDEGKQARVLKADGLSPVEKSQGREFVGSAQAALTLDLSESDGVISLQQAMLQGKLAADGNSISFTLSASAMVRRAGAAVELLGGGAALVDASAGDGWHVQLRPVGDAFVYDLVADREGEIPLQLRFDVPVVQDGDWRVVDARLPAGVVVPMWLDGLATAVKFDAQRPVVPMPDAANWRGFLPADGNISFAWRTSRNVEDGALFFSSAEVCDVRFGSGLLRQLSMMDFRILQGKLPEISIALDGPGEVLSVQGEHIVGWSVRENAGKRSLVLQLNRPMEGAGKIIIESQAALTDFPCKTKVLRLLPQGSLRHNGWLRIANEGAVKLEVLEPTGLIQVAPEQFPLPAKNLRQAFVYRFPAAEYSYQVLADHVLPETMVLEQTIYELAETDRRMISEIELDIREAPLREWEIDIPSDFTVVACTGAAVADFSLATQVIDGRKRLKILFSSAVKDRQLVQLRLEKNDAAKAGDWVLLPLLYPQAKSQRGLIGVVATAGYRVAAKSNDKLIEIPLSYFPKQTPGLQQAYRTREGAWSATMNVEALGQSVQADVFHLYSIKEGAVYGSVLFNYFVVGAPASEWRVEVPEGVGNIDITGQNVSHEWRRDGNQLIIPLSRPLLGSATMLLSFEQPIAASGGTISPGEIRPLNVQSERGYMQVVSPLQVNHEEVAKSGSLLPLQANELPTEYRMLSTAPTLGAWQYTARDFTLGVKFSWYQAGETVEQVVDFVKLASTVSRDGQWVTEAKFFVKSKGREALRMKLPQGAVLWETKVQGETANPREDQGEIVIPLPQKNDLNQAVEIALRYGQQSEKESHVRLVAPILQAPTVMGEWTISGDEGRVLTPTNRTVEQVNAVPRETGFSWLAAHPMHALGLVFLMAIAWLCASRGKFAWLAFAAVLGAAVVLAINSLPAVHVSSSMLEFAAPVVNAGAEMVVELRNEDALFSNVGWGLWILGIFGLAIVVRGGMLRDRWWIFCGLIALAYALLSLHFGAPWFFAVIALYSLVMLIKSIKRSKPSVEAGSVAALLLVGALVSMQPLDAQVAGVAKTADAMMVDASLKENRLFGNIDVTVRAEVGDRFAFLQAPAVLGEFAGTGLRVVREKQGDAFAYQLVAEQAGMLTGKARFEMPIADPQQPWTLPCAVATMRKLSVRWDRAGWEFVSSAAAQVQALAGLGEQESGAMMMLKPASSVEIVSRPKQRDLAAEKSVYFVEASHLFMPLPGVINGRHSFQVRPSQGRVTELFLTVPKGFTVSDVSSGPVGVWRFDPKKSELRVAIEPAQSKAFSFLVETQQGSAALPLDVTLEPLRVNAAAGEVGLMAIAFGDDAQAEKATPKGLSLVNPDDFDAELLPRDAKGEALALVQQVYRYGSAAASLQLRVAPVAAELRADSWQILSLGDDRMLLAADLKVTITRSGIFRLLLEIPAGMEMESVSGAALSHWTESEVEKKRMLTLHLNGRTMGEQEFHLSLTGAATGANKKWQVPRLMLREATRESGILTIVPEQGMRVGVVEREHVSPMDPRELGDAPGKHATEALRNGALSFRLLQNDWKLGLSIDKLDPWVTAQVFHEVVLREGQMSSSVGLVYQIENASMKNIRVRIPGLTEAGAATVRATGDKVADFVKVEGEADLWEIRCKHSVSGNHSVQIEFQQQITDANATSVRALQLEDAKQVAYYVAVRSGGRLELQVDAAMPEGWTRSDWAVLQSAMPKLRSTPAPALSFKVNAATNPLDIRFQRHQLANVQKMRVTNGTLTTLISAKGQALTAVNLQVQVAEKGPLSLRLPKNAQLYNVLVNDEGVSLVREGDAWLFHVFPSHDVTRPASLRFVYASSAGDDLALEGPSLSIPMESLSWSVLIPEGWKLKSHEGDFDLKERSDAGSFRLENYQQYVNERKASSSADAVALLDQANVWLASGDQEKASIALGNAARNGLLDAASNEDARVQLRELKTQQAVLGLNTRRQRVFLDNRSESQVGNQQLEQAATINPVLQGRYNYDPKQFDRFIEGNTAEENAALKAIANRIVNQQLAAEPVPLGLEIAVPERGTMLTFGRSIQVNGDRPMTLQLDLERTQRNTQWVGLMLSAVVAAAVVRLRMVKR